MVEVPSHLWENFASDRESLQLLARHRSSLEPLPGPYIDNLLQSQRMFSALELQNQAVLALVDQAYFGPQSDLDLGSSTLKMPRTSRLWMHLTEKHSSIRHPQGTHPQARITHFTVYGGSYYSYIYARFLSSALWSKFMERRGKETFLDKGEPGRAIWDVLLAPGGSKEPLDQCRDLGLHLLPWGDRHSLPRGWSPTIDQGGLERLLKG